MMPPMKDEGMDASADSATKAKLLEELMSYLAGSDAKDLGSKFAPKPEMEPEVPAAESAEPPGKDALEGESSDPMALLAGLDEEQLKALLAQLTGDAGAEPKPEMPPAE